MTRERALHEKNVNERKKTVRETQLEKKPLIISAAIFILAILAAVLIGLAVKSCNKEPEKVWSTADFTYKTDIKDIENILNMKDEGFYVLVNKDNPAGEEYVPDGLITVDKGYTLYEKEIQLQESVAAAARAMIDEMRADGIDDVYVTSGYRDYKYQETLFNNYVYEEWTKDKSLTQEQCKQKVLEYAAYPGTSEHQSGLCMDLITLSSDLVNYSSETDKAGKIGFAETRAYTWLCENAYRFGFILRYPEDKVDITKYQYESWHYRFVGIDAAKKIYDSSVTLEEWLENSEK